MENWTELNRENIQFLIEDEATRQQMDQLLQDTDEIAWVVWLSASGKHFALSDGAVVNTFTTTEVPLIDYTVRAVYEMLRALATSANVHRKRLRLQGRDELVKRRKETCAVTERFYAAAAGMAHDISAVHDLKARAAALGNEMHCEPTGPKSTICYRSHTLAKYPFDPLTEPRCVTDGAYLEWKFAVPDYWQLLVALVMYEEAQAKEQSAE